MWLAASAAGLDELVKPSQASRHNSCPSADTQDDARPEGTLGISLFHVLHGARSILELRERLAHSEQQRSLAKTSREQGQVHARSPVLISWQVLAHGP